MPWVKLDDNFLTNPKIMRAGLQGRALYVAGLCYCATGLTDGNIPVDAVLKLGALADVRKPTEAVARLVELGLWETSAEGYRVHDYLKYQPSADDTRKERERVEEERAAGRAKGYATVGRGTNGRFASPLEAVRQPPLEAVNGTPLEAVASTATREDRYPYPARPVKPDPARPEYPPNPPASRGGGLRRRRNSKVEFNDGGDEPQYQQRTAADGTREWVEVTSNG
jgi:hypothetical protein